MRAITTDAESMGAGSAMRITLSATSSASRSLASPGVLTVGLRWIGASTASLAAMALLPVPNDSARHKGLVATGLRLPLIPAAACQGVFGALAVVFVAAFMTDPCVVVRISPHCVGMPQWAAPPERGSTVHT